MTLARVLVVAGFVRAAPAVLAQGSNVDSDDTHYTFNWTDDGYLRLDGRTAQVSLC